MINLCLVVIATQFSETKKRETERMKLERKRFHSSSTLASNSEPGGCYDEIIKYLAHIMRRAKRKINRFLRMRRGKHQRRVTPEKAISLRRKRRRKKAPPTSTSGPTSIINPSSTSNVHLHHHPSYHYHQPFHISSLTDSNPRLAPRASPEVSDIDLVSSPRRPTHLLVPSDISGNPSMDSLQTVTYTAECLATPHAAESLAHCQQSSSPNNNNHIVTPISLGRTLSVGGAVPSSPVSVPPAILAGRHMSIPCPDLLTVPGTRNHAGSHVLVPMEYDANKLHPSSAGTDYLDRGKEQAHLHCSPHSQISMHH